MKKKWELLKYAYDNYTNGTKFTWGRKDLVSTGSFELIELEDRVRIRDSSGHDVYDSDFTDGWAEIIPESIISGKCAIQVSNEREFKLLMEHYESKGWTSIEVEKPTKIPYAFKYEERIISYGDAFVYPSFGTVKASGHKESQYDPDTYTIIPFSDFADEVGIKVPVFIQDTQDKVPLYIGDNFWIALNKNGLGKWVLDNHDFLEETDGDIYKFLASSVSLSTKNNRYFSTREAAEEWIMEQNKPNEITLFKDGSNNPYAVVTKNVVDFTKPGDNHIYRFTSDEIKQIWEAHQSLL